MTQKVRRISSKDKARAAKALIYVDELTPAARRVGLALLDHLNNYTAQCDPGEARLAGMLHMTERAVRLGKEQLKRKGYLTWKSHGGLPLTADYRFRWQALHAECDHIEAAAKLLLPRRRLLLNRKNSSGMNDDDDHRQNGHTGNFVQQTGTTVPEPPEENFRQTYPLNSPRELYQEALKEQVDAGESPSSETLSVARAGAPIGSAVARPRVVSASQPSLPTARCAALRASKP